MSAHAAPTKRLTLRDLDVKKHAREPIVMVTAYDFPSAQIVEDCLLYTSPSPRDKRQSRMPSSA